MAGLVVVLATALKVFACRSQLMALRFNEGEYRHEHEGHPPPDVFALAAAFHGYEAITPSEVIVGRLTCPGVGNGALTPTNAALTSSYIYVNWEGFYGTNHPPSGYPLLYDGHLSNHHGWGVNIMIFGEGCVWDFHAKRLHAFAVKHPEYKLVMPD
jgi:hypothetical protein